MGIKYFAAADVKQLTDAIVEDLGFAHIRSEHVYCFRSLGSKSKRTVARVHSLGKLWQQAMETRPRYLIEVIAERFDRLSQEDKEKVIIHELLHIPKGFSGGFRPHKGYVTQKSVDRLHYALKHHQRVKATP
jgi:predicted metallopeptidase